MFFKKKEKQTQESFFWSEATITEYLADGLLVFDRNSRVVLVNAKTEELFEVKREKLLGKSIFELNRFPNFIPLVSLLGGGIKKFFREELEIRENFILEITTVPMITKNYKTGTLVILHDVTKEKLTERMKSEFVTLAAHQLRTPTSAVKWSMKALLDGDLGELNEKQKKIIEEAYRTNDKAIKLINDLLNVAQIEEGKYLSKMTLSDIEDIINSVIDVYRQELERKKIRFEYKRPKQQIPKLMLDKEKMRIAIKNIFDNAVRYTPAGGKISVILKTSGKEIEVQIKDTGLGIPLDEQEKVFTKFFRGGNVMRVETEGSGLGLFLSKNIIEAHGGMIWFDSKEGKGSTFYFTVPIKQRFGEFLTKEFY